MARKNAKKHSAPKEKEKYPYPSRFGSHTSMIVEVKGEWVICEDEDGLYPTLRRFIDTGLADPHRFSTTVGYRKQALKALKANS
tara:strand:- start:231 stop:482 length:252 start_codon:yes stop_codon:yes gene_type:complete